jgi:hypothetical protein
VVVTKAEAQLEELLRVNQIDLGAISRERLESLFQGLLLGQIKILESLAEETKFTKVVAAQQQAIEEQRLFITGQQRALDQALAAFTEPTLDDKIKDLLIGLLEAYPTTEMMELGLVRAFRLLEREGIELSDEATHRWSTWEARPMSAKPPSVEPITEEQDEVDEEEDR